MTPDQLRGLREGDLIQSQSTHLIYLVTGHDGGHVTAVQTVDVVRSEEWTLVAKAQYGFRKHPRPAS